MNTDTLARATAARERGEATLAAAEAELKRLQEYDSIAIDRHAARLTNWVRDGHSGAAPVLAADPAHEQAVRTAQHSVAAARKALLTLAADEIAAKAALSAAERKAAEALTARKSRECDRIAARMAAIWSEEEECAARLMVAGVPLSKAATDTLNAPPARPTPARFSGGPAVPDIYSPISGTAHRGSTAAAERFWQQFEADESSPAADVAA